MFLHINQPPPISMPSFFWILHGEAKSYYLTVSCFPESMFWYHYYIHGDFLFFGACSKFIIITSFIFLLHSLPMFAP